MNTVTIGNVEYFSRERFSNYKREMVAHPREQGTTTANIATDLVTKWGMVAAIPDGEDNAGRQKMALLSPDEIVTRAVETAERLVASLRERGHLVAVPPISELEEAVGIAPEK